MWHVTVEEQLRCDGCEHIISPGQECISDLPEQLPKGVVRQHNRHFHSACPQCEETNGELPESCYQVFASQLVTEKAPQKMVCLDCGHLILEGEEFLQDFFFIRDDGRSRNDFENGRGPAALISTLAKCSQINPSKLSQFSQATIGKFQRAGLGNRRGFRNPAEAARFYRKSVPGPVRHLGEDSVKQFTKGKVASHIRSVANEPGQAKNPANIIWEGSKANTKRGAKNMGRIERVSINALNAADTVKILGRASAKNAGKGAAWAVLLEFPVSLMENSISVYRGKKTRQEALTDSGRDVATAGVAGGVMAAGATLAVAAGAGPALAAASPVLVPVGIGIFAISSGSRIWRAWKDGLAMLELNFHADCPGCETDSSCYLSFADWVSQYSDEAGLLEQKT